VSVSAYSRQHGHQSTDLDIDSIGSEPTAFCVDRLEPGNYRLKFEGPEIEPVTLNDVKAPIDDIEVELHAVGKPILAGTVIDSETGELVEKFKVRVKKLKTHRGPHYVQRNQWTQMNNQKGTFEVEAVGPGLYQVQIASDGYAPLWSEPIDTDNNHSVQMLLNKGGTLTGIVKDINDRPVANAKVIPLSIAGGANNNTMTMFVSSEGAVQTDRQGEFTLSQLPEGNETLKVTHADFADGLVESIPIVLNQVAEIEPVILNQGAAIEGIVLDGSGRPESGATIFVQDDSAYSGGNDEKAGRLAVAISDPNGYYRVDHLPEQMCYLRRQDEGQAQGVVRRTVLPLNGKTARIDFGGQNKLTGQIILEGQPLVNERIQMAPAGNPHFGTFKAFAVTDEKGYFHFYPGISGSYVIYHQVGKRRDWNEMVRVQLTAGEDLDLGVIPKPSTTLNVYLDQEPEGFQWAVSSLSIQAGDNKFGPATATATVPSEKGKPYVINNLQDGQYLIAICRSDELIYRVPVEITEGQSEKDVVIDLPVSNCSVNIIAAEDVQYLILWNEDESIQMVLQLNEAKHFTAENLPAGRYSITNGMSSGNTLSLADFDLSAEQIETIDISHVNANKTEMGVLQVEVVDENGSPVDDCQLWLVNNEGKTEPTMRYGFTVAFSIPAGEYTIQTERPGYQDITKSVTLNPVKPGDPGAKLQKMLLRLEPQQSPDN
jgi:protocatechuate 3,4-dioxygenase beta subunit